MSAIYGIISTDGKKIRKEAAEDFLRCYKKNAIDNFRAVETESLLMGCGIQYYTEEAKEEVLPIYDGEKQICFTADCVIDNRKELIKELAPAPVSEKTPDGTLLYYAFLKWGKDCCTHVRGLYSFAAYNADKKEVVFGADHFGCRCLFFHVRGGTVYFSTLLMPLAEASGLKFELNKEWLTDSISVLTPAMMFETVNCAYKDVFKVDAGNTVTVSFREQQAAAASIHRERYYDPAKNVRINKDLTDEKVKSELIRILKASTECAVRTCGEAGIQLSSGLDSTSIAGFAAPLLEKDNKKLLSYTSVPHPESPADSNRYYVDNETEGVMKVVSLYPNIEPKFLDCAEKNILTEGKRIVDCWELPCQSQQNAVWVDDIMRTAAADGCKIMLSGSTGNCTLSAGKILDNIMILVRRGHPLKGLKLYRTFCRKHRLPAKKIIRSEIKNYMKYLGLKLRLKRFDNRKFILTSEKLLKETRFNSRVERKQLMEKPWMDIKGFRNCVYLKNAYAQIGEIETKMSLAYGILSRDPLRNVDFIDFCMSLPMRFFADENYERRLVREFLQGVVPTDICTDTTHRGRQSGDNAFRISKNWDEYSDKVLSALLSETGREFFDEKAIRSKFDSLSAENLTKTPFELRMCIDGALFVYYTDSLKKFC